MIENKNTLKNGRQETMTGDGVRGTLAQNFFNSMFFQIIIFLIQKATLLRKRCANMHYFDHY